MGGEREEIHSLNASHQLSRNPKLQLSLCISYSKRKKSAQILATEVRRARGGGGGGGGGLQRVRFQVLARASCKTLTLVIEIEKSTSKFAAVSEKPWYRPRATTGASARGRVVNAAVRSEHFTLLIPWISTPNILCQGFDRG